MRPGHRSARLLPARQLRGSRLRQYGLALALVVVAAGAFASPAAAAPFAEANASFPGEDPDTLTVSSEDGTFTVNVSLTGCSSGSAGQTLKFLPYGNGTDPGGASRFFNYRPTTDYGVTFGRQWVGLPFTDPNGDGTQDFVVSFDLGTTLDSGGEEAGPVPASSTFQLGAFQGLSCINGGQSDLLSLTVTQPDPVPTWTSTELDPFQAGVPFSSQVSAEGATSYAVSTGTLPAGITLEAATGTLSGTPTTAGPYSFSLVANDGELTSDPFDYSGAVAAATQLDRPTAGTVTVDVTSAQLGWTSSAAAWEYRWSVAGVWTDWALVEVPELRIADLASGTSYVAEVRAVDPDSVHPSSEALSIPFTTSPPPPTTTAPESGAGAATVDLEASPGQAVAGAEAVVSAWGLQPGAQYTVVLRSTPRVLATGVVATDGTILQSVVIPTGLEPGWHSLTLNATRLDGSALVEALWFEVSAQGTLVRESATAPASRLPDTGFGAGEGLMVVGALLLTGTALVVTARRRRPVGC